MGLILDSSVLIAAERDKAPVGGFLRDILSRFGDQETALSAIALVELAHGIHRAHTEEVRARREAFIHELLADVPVFPFTGRSRFAPAKSTRTSKRKG